MDAFAPTHFEARPSLKPSAFRAAGQVTSATFCRCPAIPPRRRRFTQAQKFGKRYEGRVLSYLSKEFVALKASPWISFATSRETSRLCQPDAILVGLNQADVTIFEVKARHTVDAYWQLRYLYEPVIRSIYPSHKIRLVEIVKSFDGAVRFPEPFTFHFDLDSWLLDLPEIGVIQWTA